MCLKCDFMNVIITKYFTEWIDDVSLNHITNFNCQFVIKLPARDYPCIMKTVIFFILNEGKQQNQHIT